MSKLLSFIPSGDLNKAKILVSFFYFFLLVTAVSRLPWIKTLVIQGQANFSPPWPLMWAQITGIEIAAFTVLISLLITSITACFFYRRRWSRILVFVALLQFNALMNSFEIRSQQWDLWVWVAMFFALLPDVWSKDLVTSDAREKFLTIFWGSQAMVLLIYSMAGMWKVIAAVQQLFTPGEMSILNPQSPAVHIATSFLHISSQEVSMLGPAIIEHPEYAWVPLLALMYLQFFSFAAAIRPSLHPLWAFGLVTMHVSIYLTLNVQFFQHIPIILMLLADSPFYKRGASVVETAFDLPIFGFILKRLRSVNA